ncbi:flagellar hook capping FlgD N-terminal domain-containing protein [Yoonia sp. 208BN28-4]|uniref:flagellar hook capping FlgD N-terminal domain-containing protein n=1 Tax=Yoonia sp. 208BN28-4 TaxID=3126505 RepID=UPI0030AF02DC
MEITQTPPAFAGTPLPEAETASAITSDFDTFLRMLTVQMQNQDPLNPIESSDYAVQLATFSGVEQQVQTNDLLRNLASQMGASGLTDFASWVGKEVRAPSGIAFDGTPVPLTPTIASGATTAEIIVRDTSGNEVQRQPIDINAQSVDWAGVTADGYPLPAGTYQFATVSYNADGILSEDPISSYAEVTEVRTGPNGAELVLQGGVVIPAAAATALRPIPTD